MEAHDPPLPLLRPSDVSHSSKPTNNVRKVYAVTYLTAFWPQALAPSLDPVYAEQYDGLIGIYSDFDSALLSGTKWLEKRAKEVEVTFFKDGARADGGRRAKWIHGWSQVIDKGKLYDIWVNWVDPGLGRAVVKIRGRVVCSMDLEIGEGDATQYQHDKETAPAPTMDLAKLFTEGMAGRAPDYYDVHQDPIEDAPTPYVGVDQDSLTEYENEMKKDAELDENENEYDADHSELSTSSNVDIEEYRDVR